ncbi:MAG TPA: hypothetical protein PKY81_10015 [bacterium]|nr:hypothetical protein [bacterium]HPN31282.1 hypothetical protein [bacterium]
MQSNADIYADHKNGVCSERDCLEISCEELAAITTCISQILEGARFKIRNLKKIHIYKWSKFIKKNSVGRNEIFNTYWR